MWPFDLAALTAPGIGATNASMRPILAVCLALLLASALFLLWPGLDLRVASLFYLGGGAFLFDDSRLALAIHDAVPAMMQLAGGAIVLLLAHDLYRRRPAADAVRQAVYLAACFIVGPGLIANTLFKDNWGRPRPTQVAAFGGP